MTVLLPARFQLQKNHRLVVLVVPVVLQLAVVDGVEEDHATDNDLEERGNAHPLRLPVLVLPSPEGTAHGTDGGPRVLVAAAKPSAQLTQLHLAERGVRLAVEAGRIVRSVHLRVVLRRIVSESHFSLRVESAAANGVRVALALFVVRLRASKVSGEKREVSGW